MDEIRDCYYKVGRINFILNFVVIDYVFHTFFKSIRDD